MESAKFVFGEIHFQRKWNPRNWSSAKVEFTSETIGREVVEPATRAGSTCLRIPESQQVTRSQESRIRAAVPVPKKLEPPAASCILKKVLPVCPREGPFKVFL